MSEIVFILGAGASREAGAPLMVDFLDKADELRKSDPLDGFENDFDRVFQAISSLQAVHSKAQLNIDNIESVFAAFEMGRIINKLPGIQSNEIESLLLSIRRLISKTLEMTVIYPVKDKQIRPDSSYNSFVQLLARLEDDSAYRRCSIITFNYDLALDYALHFSRRSADYCLSESTVQHHTPVMKLHGSLNWARCSDCGGIVPLPFSTFFGKFHFPFLGMPEFKSARLDIASKLSSCGLEHCGKIIQSEPVIVPPTWNKTDYHQSLSKVWRRAASELSNAESTFVSGYSLTETDSFFRYLFALGSLGTTRIKRFWVFDPDERTVRPRFEKLLGEGVKARFMFESLTFRDAIALIGSELSPAKS